jgi:hypothetical protein
MERCTGEFVAAKGLKIVDHTDSEDYRGVSVMDCRILS